MNLACAHVVVNTTNVAKAREYYIKRMGFDLIEDHPNSFAFSAGGIRFSVSPNGSELKDSDPCNTTIIFRTSDLERTLTELRDRGLEFDDQVREAPGFMKFVSFADPDNNPLMIAQYLRDPTNAI